LGTAVYPNGLPAFANATELLTILKGTPANWVAVAKGGTSPKLAPGSRSVQELEAKVSRLRKELAETRIERDIVKKAAAYFARESLPNTRS
jgi:transposase